MLNPLVSVILPVYNGEKYLSESINCVLSQKYQPFELIIIDDGSTDDTAKIAANFSDQIRYFYQTNSGPAMARNLGICKARGEFIAFIDSDDLWPENKLNSQIDCFKRFPSIDIVQGLIRRINLLNKDEKDINFLFIYSNLGSMIMRRSVFERIGLFDKDLLFHEDTDLWIRAREGGLNILVQRKESLIYRIHGNNLTTGMDIKSTKFLNIIWKSILRRRNSSGKVKEIPKLLFIPNIISESTKENAIDKAQLKSWPQVSVILYNCKKIKMIRKALKSISAQEYPSIQLFMIVNSMDLVPKSINKLFDQVMYLDENSSDLAISLNNAINLCTGEYIAFLDSNAEWAQEKLFIQISYLMEHLNEDCCLGRARYIIEPDKKYSPDLIDNLTFRKNFGDQFGTFIVRRSTFETIGKFSTGKSFIVEADWFLRATDFGISRKILPDVLIYRYVFADTFQTDKKRLKSALMNSVFSSIKRKRNTQEYC